MTGTGAFRQRDAARKSVRRARAALESIGELLEPSARLDSVAVEEAVHELLQAAVELKAFSRAVEEAAKSHPANLAEPRVLEVTPHGG